MSLLSICLPVRNGQAMLESLVLDALDILHDLVPRAEIVILDNGSTDATSEIAHELVTRYPQVRKLGFPLPVSRELLWRAALAEVRGDTLLMRDGECRLDIHDMIKLWQELPGRDAVLAHTRAEKTSGWVGVIQRLGQAASRAGEGAERIDLALVRRRAFDAARAAANGRTTLGEELTRFGHPWMELTLRSRGMGSIPAAPQGMPAGDAADVGQAASSVPQGGRVRKPNYLSGLKNFALGE